MNTIKLNEYTFIVDNYNKSANYSGEHPVCNGYCSVVTTDMNSIMELAKNTINSVQIYHDEELIYNLDNANGKILTIDELLNPTSVKIGINMTFALDAEQ